MSDSESPAVAIGKPKVKKLPALLCAAGAFLFLLLAIAGYFIAPVRIPKQDLMVTKGASAREVAHMLKTGG